MAQFKGKGGVFYKGTANVAMNNSVYQNPYINGVVVVIDWDKIESTPGNFNWTYIDGELVKAKQFKKYVSILPVNTPSWFESIGVQKYYNVDLNTYHATYGKIISGIVPWDTIYIKRYKLFLQNLAFKYANDTTVAYINAIGMAISRNMPSDVITDTVTKASIPFYQKFSYNADSLAVIMNRMTDYYMNLFPNTPVWCSVDYVLFETAASGKPKNYLPSLACNYGIRNYPDRFGLWREDIAGCNPGTSIPTSSQWYLLQQNPTRTGAQMLWSVQDLTTTARMNKCRILPNTKPAVMDSAVNNRGREYITSRLVLSEVRWTRSSEEAE